MNNLDAAWAAHAPLVAVLGLATLVSPPALAAHAVVYGPETYTFAAVDANDANARAEIRNLFASPASNFANGVATTETQVLSANGYSVAANVSAVSTGAPGRTTSAATYSSLDTGIMRTQIIQTNPRAFGYPLSDTQTQFQDTFFFSNTSGHAISLDLRFGFDGTAQVFEPNSLTGLAFLILGGCGVCGNAQGDTIRFAATGAYASVAAYSLFNEGGVYSVYDQYSGQPLDALGFSVQTNTNGIGSIIQTSILVPTGETSLGFKASLGLSARGAASADFGHTAQFGVGALADGLSYTTASGVFLTALPVPEPATWAMMLGGMALMGAALRRRSARLTLG